MSHARAAFGVIETAAQTADLNFRAAIRRLQLGPNLETALSTPWRETHMRIPVRMDDDSLHVFETWRVQHNSSRGPSLGALRFSPDVTLELQRAAAQTATWQCALVQIPFGGSASGIACDPQTLSPRELESLTRAFASRNRRLLGIYEDIIAPGPETPSCVMPWVVDELKRPAIAVAAPPVDAPVATAMRDSVEHCLSTVVSRFAREIRLPLEGSRVVILGSDSRAKSAVRAMAALGCTIIGFGDRDGGWYASEGLDVETLLSNATPPYRSGLFFDHLLGTECDICVVASAESSINVTNADRLLTRMLIEASNLSVTPSADRTLEQHGILVVPDLLANAGTLIDAALVWEQNMEHAAWREEALRVRMEGMLERACNLVIARASDSELSLRNAAYDISIERVARMERLRGVA